MMKWNRFTADRSWSVRRCSRATASGPWTAKLAIAPVTSRTFWPVLCSETHPKTLSVIDALGTIR